MAIKRAPPRSLAIGNITFVEFREPAIQYAGRWAYLDRLAQEGREAMKAYKATIMRTAELARRARDLITPGGVREGPAVEDSVADLLLEQGSADLSPAQSKA